MSLPAFTDSGATFSPCGRYRYRLWRQWADGRTCAFVMLNPSTADATKLDPTVTRCVGFAERWGFGRLEVANVYAYRATDPRALLGVEDPYGPENDDAILSIGQNADLVVAAWGNRVTSNRATSILTCYANVYSLGELTKHGAPRHPLYVKADTLPALWRRKR